MLNCLCVFVSYFALVASSPSLSKMVDIGGLGVTNNGAVFGSAVVNSGVPPSIHAATMTNVSLAREKSAAAASTVAMAPVIRRAADEVCDHLRRSRFLLFRENVSN